MKTTKPKWSIQDKKYNDQPTSKKHKGGKLKAHAISNHPFRKVPTLLRSYLSLSSKKDYQIRELHKGFSQQPMSQQDSVYKKDRSGSWLEFNKLNLNTI